MYNCPRVLRRKYIGEVQSKQETHMNYVRVLLQMLQIKVGFRKFSFIFHYKELGIAIAQQRSILKNLKPIEVFILDLSLSTIVKIFQFYLVPQSTLRTLAYCQPGSYMKT